MFKKPQHLTNVMLKKVFRKQGRDLVEMTDRYTFCESHLIRLTVINVIHEIGVQSYSEMTTLKFQKTT